MRLSDVYRHSMVIASDYRIPDPSKVGRLLRRRTDALTAMGAHHVLVYRALRDPGRVLVMIGVHSKEPVVELLRSRVFFNWFDDAGVEDIPAVFAGEIAGRFDHTDSDVAEAPGVLVSAFLLADDVESLLAEFHAQEETFKAAGVRKVWLFQAFDDPRELMIVQEIDTEEHAWNWTRRHDAATEWFKRTGVGVYPSLFVGEFLDLLRVDDPDPAEPR
ncbi:MAG: fatty-acid--CoA ligase [Mycobacterium sp.]|nr:fatty-acid--CoA ligase [Mycobacterium sp.]